MVHGDSKRAAPVSGGFVCRTRLPTFGSIFAPAAPVIGASGGSAPNPVIPRFGMTGFALFLHLIVDFVVYIDNYINIECNVYTRTHSISRPRTVSWKQPRAWRTAGSTTRHRRWRSDQYVMP